MVDAHIFEQFTQREKDVLMLLAQCLSNQEIADRLFLSPNTVKWYVRRLNIKLGTSNRDEIVARANEMGFLQSEKAPLGPMQYNLPRQSTNFIGRKAELDAIASLLEMPEVRLLTILAPGGMGKTRVALEVAQQQEDNFSDGVYFVGLQSLIHADDIIPAIARSVGYQFHNRDIDLKTQLLEYFVQKQILLLIDNWEHLLDGISIISEILLAAPEVKILATSRVKLNLSNEAIYQLRGMPFPKEIDISEILQYDAVELFIHSAQRLQPDFELNPDTVADLVRVCQLTAGMPLAILLSATWLDMLSLSELAAELEQGMELLQTRMHDIQERHQNIQMIFDHSWQRLTREEQQVFMQLSVFPNDFTRKAAQTVADTTVLTLRGLIDKAMIQVKDKGRYDIHGLLRQYAIQKLEATDSVNIAYEHHSEYYLTKLCELWPDLKGERQLGALDDIEADYENFRAAWQWAVVQSRFDLIDVSIDALTFFHDISSRNHEHINLFDFAKEKLAPAPNEEPHPVWAKLLARRWGLLQWSVPADLSLARNDLELSVKIAKKNSDLFETAYCELMQGQLEHHCEKWGKSIKYWQESLNTFRKIGDPYYIAWALDRVAIAYYYLGEFEEAIKLTHQAITLAENHGNIARAGIGYTNIGGAYMMNGEPYQALETIEIALELNRKVQRNQMYWLSVGLKSYWSFCVGRFEEAVSLAESSRQEMLRYNLPDLSCCEATLVSDACVKEDYERAFHLVQQMQDYFILKVGDFLTCWVSCVTACGRGQYAEARNLLSHYIHDPIVVKCSAVAEVLPIASIILAHEGQIQWAVELLSLESALDYAITTWMRYWPLLKRLRDELKQILGNEAFEVAWEQGKTLDLKRTFESIRSESSPDNA